MALQTVPHKYAVATRLVHADDHSEPAISDMAPPLHVATTFSVAAGADSAFTYSRHDHPTRHRVETVLATLCGGPTLCFASGLAAVSAVLYAARPKRLFTMLGYFGSRSAVNSYRAIGCNQVPETSFDLVSQLLEQELESGDLVMIETPRNPDARLIDIELVAAHVRRVNGALLAVDNTFATPYIVQPLALGAHFEINSCSKYLAGHSDAIMGTVSVRPECRGLEHALHSYRTDGGAVPGSLEVWLLLRSIRTLSLRVDRQTRSAFRVAQWLAQHAAVTAVLSPCIESDVSHAIWPKYYAADAAPACFSFTTPSAEKLPAFCELFADCTSLGGIESNLDWRYRWDRSVARDLIRVSIGLEDPDDLITDLAQAFERVAAEPVGADKKKKTCTTA